MKLALKIDVDTERGTRLGVPALCNFLEERGIQATFLFSLGRDNTGRALKRVFRPGFLKKVSRTSVVQVYGVKTLLNGILWPGPHIGRRHAALLRQVKTKGHEVGIHCYDHIRWQDGLAHMSLAQVQEEIQKSQDCFTQIFQEPARTRGAAGWQANAHSLQAYDEQGFLYGSDVRGSTPFFPYREGRVFQTLQVPTTLPTLDELIGRPEYPLTRIPAILWEMMEKQEEQNLEGLPTHVWTLHAELEGMHYSRWFCEALDFMKEKGVEFITCAKIAQHWLAKPSQIPVCSLEMGTVDGRSGTLACQGRTITETA